MSLWCSSGLLNQTHRRLFIPFISIYSLCGVYGAKIIAVACHFIGFMWFHQIHLAALLYPCLLWACQELCSLCMTKASIFSCLWAGLCASGWVSLYFSQTFHCHKSFSQVLRKCLKSHSANFEGDSNNILERTRKIAQLLLSTAALFLLITILPNKQTLQPKTREVIQAPPSHSVSCTAKRIKSRFCSHMTAPLLSDFQFYGLRFIDV